MMHGPMGEKAISLFCKKSCTTMTSIWLFGLTYMVQCQTIRYNVFYSPATEHKGELNVMVLLFCL